MNKSTKYHVDEVTIDDNSGYNASFDIQTKEDFTAFIAANTKSSVDGRCEHFFKIHYNIADGTDYDGPWIQVVYQPVYDNFGNDAEYEEFMSQCADRDYCYEGEYYESSIADKAVFRKFVEANPELFVFCCGDLDDFVNDGNVLADYAGDIGRGWLNYVNTLHESIQDGKEIPTFALMELKDVDKAINEGIIPLYPLDEGINVSNDSEGHRLVHLTDEHDRGIRMGGPESQEMFHISDFDRDIELYSVFLRNSDMETDGNPLIYALKNERGWYISDADRQEVIRRVSEHVKELRGTADIIVQMPSSNQLNKEITKAVAQTMEIPVLSDKFFMKFTKEAFFSVMPFDFDGLKKDGIDTNWFYQQCIRWERQSETDYFRYHDIPPKYRKYIVKQPFFFHEEDMVEIAPMLNGKRVMVIDDTVTTGMSLREACKVIVGTFDVSKLIYVTLLSPLDAKPKPMTPKGRAVSLRLNDSRKDLKF